MNLLRSAATVSSFTLLSRITGLARDILIARVFGADSLTDAFWVAFRIPNLLRRLFAEGAFAQAFVPILGEVKSRQQPEEARRLLDHVATLLTYVLMAVTLAGVVAAPLIVSIMGSGLRGAERASDFASAVWMTRVMFPYILCMSLVAFASGVLNTWRHFAVPAFTPLLLNLAMIGAAIWIAPHLDTPIYALALGVMVGGIAQLAIQFVALARLGMAPRIGLRLREAWQDPVVRRILRQMLPAIVGVSVAQLSLLINTNIATWLAPGSVSWLSFADRLMEFPTSMLGVALSTVLLPNLSQAHASGRKADYSALLDWGLRLTLLVGLPACLGLAMISKGLVATLFHYGAFGERDVAQTQIAVQAYSVGLIGLLAVKILAPGFYARQDIRTPVKIALVVLVATQCLNLIFVPIYHHAGLALSIGLAACINALALLVGLLRLGVYRPSPGWGGFFARMAVALVAMGAILWLANAHVDWIGLRAQPMVRVGWLAATIGGAAAVYFGVLHVLGFNLRQFYKGAHV
jgi:putative peptidoglycan lipid II flippase